uniref:Uncharacterized protein n=1 Tax=Amphimedon queenslandica TaxID=400682 RepID=A0A1X7UUR5_AMPQE
QMPAYRDWEPYCYKGKKDHQHYTQYLLLVKPWLLERRIMGRIPEDARKAEKLMRQSRDFVL